MLINYKPDGLDRYLNCIFLKIKWEVHARDVHRSIQINRYLKKKKKTHFKLLST